MKMKTIKKYIAYMITSMFFIAVIVLALKYTIDQPRYDLILQSRAMLWKAFAATIWISLITLAVALVVGLILFVMKRSELQIVHAFAVVFSEIIMGTPLLVMIFLVVYPFGQMIQCDNKLVLGIVAMIIYNSPYIANAYETAAAVVTKEQYTVMEVYQFKWYQKYRYVIFPQMIKPFLPSLMNNLSSVIKGSALLNIISITEITYIVKVISNKNFAVIEGYYVMWLMYLLITIPISLVAQYIGKRVS